MNLLKSKNESYVFLVYAWTCCPTSSKNINHEKINQAYNLSINTMEFKLKYEQQNKIKKF